MQMTVEEVAGHAGSWFAQAAPNKIHPKLKSRSNPSESTLNLSPQEPMIMAISHTLKLPCVSASMACQLVCVHRLSMLIGILGLGRLARVPSTRDRADHDRLASHSC